MVDYFDVTAANGTVQGTDGVTGNAAVQPVANGADDLGMDEISVRLFSHDPLPSLTDYNTSKS